MDTPFCVCPDRLAYIAQSHTHFGVLDVAGVFEPGNSDHAQAFQGVLSAFTVIELFGAKLSDQGVDFAVTGDSERL